MNAFADIAPYLSHPLVLIGFVLFLFLGAIQIFFRKKLTKKSAEKVMHYSFIAVLLVILLGFGLEFVKVQKAPVEPESEIFYAESELYTGWLFIGYYDEENQNYINGPYGEVAYRPNQRFKGVYNPVIGDVVHITKDRNIIVEDYDLTGMEKALSSPDLLVLEDHDYVGKKIPKGGLVTVSDIGRPLSERPDQEYQAVWIRYGLCHEDLEACRIAKAKME